jgi:hypothetical protein
MLGTWPSRLEICVVPATALAERRRLLQALERAYSVRFTPLEEGVNPAALLTFGVDPPPLRDVPTLCLAEPGHPDGTSCALEFLPDPLVPGPFRGRTLVEQETEMRPLAVEPGATVLARIGRDVVWSVASNGALVYRAGAGPSELGERERLRDRLRPGQFFGFLPLVHFLQVLTETAPSELQACFIIDDPNLHSLKYGHVSYPALARHAEKHGYHVAMAMIPLDAWLASRKAASLFRARHSQLSLLVHGNDHLRHELARARSVAESTAVAAQALQRIESFERRAGVRVSRIMAPPHSACSIVGARGVLRAGFSALCTTPAPRAPESDVALVEWHRADFVAGGLPNIARHTLNGSRDDLAFRALLGQPLVLYLHHEDLADGPDVLADAARDVATCGAVRWMPVGDLAEMQFTATAVGDTACVRLFARRARIAVPDGALRLLVELPGHDESQHEMLELSHVGRDRPLEAVFREGRAEVEVPDACDVVVALRHADTLAEGTVSYRRVRLWPLLRRLVTEGRDRLAPRLRV